MKKNKLLPAVACGLLLMSLLTPLAARAQSADAAQDLSQADSPYLDIQWNSRVIRSLLSMPTGLCQADADPDAAPVEFETDAWPRTQTPSMLRAMFYLAYDYYGMGLNHYFTFRQNLLPDFEQRFATEKPRDGDGNTQLVTPAYTAFKPSTHAKAVAGATEVASQPGDPATEVYFRHAVVDPFDLELVADQAGYYRLVSLAPVGQRTSPMDVEVSADHLHRYYSNGRTDSGAGIGLRRLSAFAWPGSNNPTAADWLPDYRFYSFFPSDPNRFPEPLRAPFELGYTWRLDDSSLGEGMLSIDRGMDKPLLCAQWRLQQEREALGQATASDRLLKALMARAGWSDDVKGAWVIPAEGY